MDTYLPQFIGAGELAGSDNEAAAQILKAIPKAFYNHLRNGQGPALAFLADAPFEQVFAFIRALALAEAKRFSPYPGSVSLLIPAYFACQYRKEDEVATIADWIVESHDNPYTPFNFRRTREYWEEARGGSPSPVNTLRRVRQMEADHGRATTVRARQQLSVEAIQGLSGAGDSGGVNAAPLPCSHLSGPMGGPESAPGW